MPKIQYITKRFTASSLAVIDQANTIVTEYQEQGLQLTIRQLYYQFVSRDWLPNQQKQYKRLINIISDARLAGLVDWEAIIDRTRNVQRRYHNTDPGQAIEAAAGIFKLDMWETQPCRVEVWIEKDALVGVIEQPCLRFDVPFFACKGYNSQSEMWRSAMRFDSWAESEQEIHIIHLGDHDPSGTDMTRDIDRRLDQLSLLGCCATINRIALNMDQVQQYGPPPNPVKLTDTRAPDYKAVYGNESWELDALDPATLRALVESTIETYIDEDKWNERVDLERKYAEEMRHIADNWESI